MLVNFTQTLILAATQEETWSLLRDTKRLAHLIPSIENLASDPSNAGGVRGNGQDRLSGTLRAELKRNQPAGTQLSMDASIEVMGKLAALGAAPIRRRANELFAQFTARLQGELSPAASG